VLVPYYPLLYRLEGIKQDLGLEEFIEGDGVCFVEWSEYIDYLLPNEFLKLNIRIDNDQVRIFEIEGKGEKYSNIEKEIERLW
jgi:tRNA threonylcarbamoyladenosine biosynthesis protein TsaE